MVGAALLVIVSHVTVDGGHASRCTLEGERLARGRLPADAVAGPLSARLTTTTTLGRRKFGVYYRRGRPVARRERRGRICTAACSLWSRWRRGARSRPSLAGKSRYLNVRPAGGLGGHRRRCSGLFRLDLGPSAYHVPSHSLSSSRTGPALELPFFPCRKLAEPMVEKRWRSRASIF